MAIFRLLLMAFNVGVIGFLIYKMFDVAKQPIDRWKKTFFVIGGIFLLLAPLGIFFRFFGPSPSYFLVYPLAIFLFLYLTKQL